MTLITPHPDSWLSAGEIGSRYFDYQPTYNEAAPLIDGYHTWLSHCSLLEDNRINLTQLGIDGWLTRDDALKLYELAYYAKGEILELGTFCGLSTLIMAQAVGNARLTPSTGKARGLARLTRRPASPPPVITTVELEDFNSKAAKIHLSRHGVAQWVTFECAEAGAFCEGLIAQGKQYSFVFVDHSHAYADMVLTCRQLPALVEAGGFVLFHDYNDTHNLDLSDADYGVSRAVFDALDMQLFGFYGIYGCTGLFRKRESTA